MFDWIFWCNFLSKALFLFVPIVALGGFALVVTFFCFRNEKRLNEWNAFFIECRKHLIVFFLFVLIVGSVMGIIRIPAIIVKSNVDRVKIKYTHPESINKIEKGALRVVDKLDKLIDKGIKNIDKESTEKATLFQ